MNRGRAPRDLRPFPIPFATEGPTMRHQRCLSLLTAAALIPLATLAPRSIAHPVFAPFDSTQFAPITRFGPTIALKPIATGLTAPNKGVAAPGDRDHLYVVDQQGIAWKVNLATGAKTVFLDVTGRLVTLGVFG